MRDTHVIALSSTTFHLSELDGFSVVEVTGDVDMVTGSHLRAVLTAGLDRCPRGLVVDMTDTAFFSSAGINALVAADRRAKDHGVAMVVVAAHRTVLHPLRITGLDEVLTLCPTRELAMAALREEQASPADRSPEEPGDVRVDAGRAV